MQLSPPKEKELLQKMYASDPLALQYAMQRQVKQQQQQKQLGAEKLTELHGMYSLQVT